MPKNTKIKQGVKFTANLLVFSRNHAAQKPCQLLNHMSLGELIYHVKMVAFLDFVGISSGHRWSELSLKTPKNFNTFRCGHRWSELSLKTPNNFNTFRCTGTIKKRFIMFLF